MGEVIIGCGGEADDKEEEEEAATAAATAAPPSEQITMSAVERLRRRVA
jgi:hypothetical protein